MSAVKAGTGVVTKRIYQPGDIAVPEAYQAMIEEPLLDEDGVLLAAVRRSGSPHFRRLGKAQPSVPLPRAPRSQRHDQVIKDLLAALNTPHRSTRLFTNVFKAKGDVKDEQTLFALPAGHNFHWFSEQQIRFDDFTYIQPDISGRSSARIAPTPLNPSVIIEVIDTHFPEPETFEKLFALSRCAYHIYFFVLGGFPNLHAQRLNKFTIQPTSPLVIRATWALINGEIIKNGAIQKKKTTDEMSHVEFSRKTLIEHCNASR